MNSEERKRQKHLQQHANDQLRKAAQKEKKARRFNERKQPPEGLDADEAEVVRLPRQKLLKPEVAGSVSGAMASGVIIETGGGGCVLMAGEEAIRCTCDLNVAVGDRVRFSPERRRVMETLPRSSALSRPDPHNPRLERVIAANIDLVVNVVSIRSPPLRPGLIDRYLIAIENSGAHPLICVNKSDLIDETDRESAELLRPYQELGLPVVQCSAETGQGLDELSRLLAGHTCVFAGHSGVGKSSLLNALVPGLDVATATVSLVHGTGQHTTTSSRLYRLPGGGVIIDTPGIREFGLWQVTPDQVRRYFHEFDALSAECDFSDCSHTHEPNCAVTPAVTAGTVSSARYESYRRIMESI